MAKTIYGALKMVTSASELPTRLTSIGGKSAPVIGTQFHFCGIVQMEAIEKDGKPYFAVQCEDKNGMLFTLSVNTVKGIFFKFGERNPTELQNRVFDNSKSLFDFVTENSVAKTLFEISAPETYTGTNFSDKTAQQMELTTYKIVADKK